MRHTVSPIRIKIFESLVKLNLSRNTNLKKKEWNGCSKLKELNVSGCDTRVLPLHLKRFDSPDKLNISENRIRDLMCLELMAHKKLKELILSRCNLYELPLKKFRVSNLRKLHLSGNKDINWDSLDEVIFRELKN